MRCRPLWPSRLFGKKGSVTTAGRQAIEPCSFSSATTCLALRSAGSGIFSRSQAEASRSRSPRVAASVSGTAHRLTILAASLEAQGPQRICSGALDDGIEYGARGKGEGPDSAVRTLTPAGTTAVAQGGVEGRELPTQWTQVPKGDESGGIAPIAIWGSGASLIGFPVPVQHADLIPKSRQTVVGLIAAVQFAHRQRCLVLAGSVCGWTDLQSRFVQGMNPFQALPEAFHACLAQRLRQVLQGAFADAQQTAGFEVEQARIQHDTENGTQEIVFVGGPRCLPIARRFFESGDTIESHVLAGRASTSAGGSSVPGPASSSSNRPFSFRPASGPERKRYCICRQHHKIDRHLVTGVAQVLGCPGESIDAESTPGFRGKVGMAAKLAMRDALEEAGRFQRQATRRPDRRCGERPA